MGEVLVELDDCGALEHFEESDFSLRRLPVLRVHVVEVDLLHRVLLAVDDVPEERHAACGALPQRPQLLILAQARELVGVGVGRRRLSALFHFLRQSSTLLHPNRFHEVIRRSELYAQNQK